MSFLGYLEIINSIEAEIKTEYIGSAIRWADEKFDGAWSKALERFDSALTIVVERKDYRLAEIEGDFYKRTILDLLSKYKQHRGIAESESFLVSIGKTPKAEGAKK